MATIRSFRAYRPRPDVAGRVAALPYDVYNRQEAEIEVKREPLSFLKVDRAETSFGPDVDTYAPCVYDKAGQLLQDLHRNGLMMEHISWSADQSIIFMSLSWMAGIRQDSWHVLL